MNEEKKENIKSLNAVNSSDTPSDYSNNFLKSEIESDHKLWEEIRERTSNYPPND